MTPDEGRLLFDDALDDELDEGTRRDFDALLASDAALRAEFERHRAVLRDAAELAREAPQVDLLKGVQDKLRARSGGRFYRDRFAVERGRSNQLVWMIALSAAMLVAAVAFLALYVLN